MKKKYVQPTQITVIEEIGPWLRGFIHKEYGNHTNPDDRLDLEQEGYLSLVNLLTKMEKSPPRFDSEEEFQFYIKAVVRNAIRDYILKFRSRFGISLFKLRRELKERIGVGEDVEQRLGDFMHAVGEEYTHITEYIDEDPIEKAVKERRLSLLSTAHQQKDMGLEEAQKLLFDIIEEYKKTEPTKGAFPSEEPQFPKLIANTVDVPSGPFVIRKPVPGVKTRKKCSSRFCNIDLQEVNSVVIDKGFGYCSKKCKKLWPPVINRIQSSYENTPIEVILKISLSLFKSKRRAAEILDISVTTFEKLSRKFELC